jgi:hypothetical protein
MSDQELGKKIVEEEDLYLFFEAYADATGEVLTSIEASERPDFVCQRAEGTIIGVELTKIMRDPESALWDNVINKQEFRDNADANEAIYLAAEWKSRKQKIGNWQHPNNTILILQVMDCPLSNLHYYLEDGNSPDDYADLGFSEVWVADYSEIDAYSVIELFGLYPERGGDITNVGGESHMDSLNLLQSCNSKLRS